MGKRLSTMGFIILALTLVLGTQRIPAETWHEIELNPAWVESDAVLHVPEMLGPWQNWLLAGMDGQVQVYEGNEITTSLGGFSGKVTTLATGDFFGTGQVYLAAATDNAGSVHFFEWDDGRWTKHGIVQYFWTPLRSLQGVATAPGQPDVLVGLDREGTLSVFQYQRHADQVFQLVWRSQPQELVDDVIAADITNNGIKELIYCRRDGYIAVLDTSSGEVRKISERYPRGAMVLLGALPASQDQQGKVWTLTMDDEESLVASTWRWSSEGLRLEQEHSTEDLGQPFGWLPQDRLLWTNEPEGLAFWSLSEQGLERQWGLNDATGRVVKRYGKWWFLKDRDHEWWTWVDEEEAETRWTIARGERSILTNVTFDDSQTNVLAPLGPTAAFLDLAITESTLEYEGGPSVELRGSYVLYNGRAELPLAIVPQEQNGEWFVPLEVFHYLGWDFSVDKDTRVIDFRRRARNLEL